MATTPDDRCPFARSFHAKFSWCEGFAPLTFQQKERAYAQLRPIVSCANLEIGRLVKGSYYPKCSLGGAAVFAPETPRLDGEQTKAM